MSEITTNGNNLNVKVKIQTKQTSFGQYFSKTRSWSNCMWVWEVLDCYSPTRLSDKSATWHRGARGDGEGPRLSTGDFQNAIMSRCETQLHSAKLTKPERDTCCLGVRGLIQEMALLPPPPLPPLHLSSESATRKNRGSKGHWGQTGHLPKTHPGRYGCDVIAAFLRQDGATSGMSDPRPGWATGF